jgi:hypothetical protein
VAAALASSRATYIYSRELVFHKDKRRQGRKYLDQYVHYAAHLLDCRTTPEPLRWGK